MSPNNAWLPGCCWSGVEEHKKREDSASWLLYWRKLQAVSTEKDVPFDDRMNEKLGVTDHLPFLSVCCHVMDWKRGSEGDGAGVWGRRRGRGREGGGDLRPRDVDGGGGGEREHFDTKHFKQLWHVDVPTIMKNHYLYQSPHNFCISFKMFHGVDLHQELLSCQFLHKRRTLVHFLVSELVSPLTRAVRVVSPQWFGLLQRLPCCRFHWRKEIKRGGLSWRQRDMVDISEEKEKGNEKKDKKGKGMVNEKEAKEKSRVGTACKQSQYAG